MHVVPCWQVTPLCRGRAVRPSVVVVYLQVQAPAVTRWGDVSDVMGWSSIIDSQSTIINHVSSGIYNQPSIIRCTSSLAGRLYPSVEGERYDFSRSCLSAGAHPQLPDGVTSPTSIINHQPSVINHQSSIISHPSSIINHQSSIIHHQPSVIHHQS